MINEKECPAGCVEGQIYHLGIDRILDCQVCNGIGWIDLDEICACGGPCIVRKDNVAYCGSNDCHLEKKKIVTGFYSRSYWPAQHHHFGNGMIDGYE